MKPTNGKMKDYGPLMQDIQYRYWSHEGSATASLRFTHKGKELVRVNAGNEFVTSIHRRYAGDTYALFNAVGGIGAFGVDWSGEHTLVYTRAFFPVENKYMLAIKNKRVGNVVHVSWHSELPLIRPWFLNEKTKKPAMVNCSDYHGDSVTPKYAANPLLAVINRYSTGDPARPSYLLYTRDGTPAGEHIGYSSPTSGTYNGAQPKETHTIDHATYPVVELCGGIASLRPPGDIQAPHVTPARRLRRKLDL